MSRECLPPEAEGKAGGTGRGTPFIPGNTGNARTEGRWLPLPYSPTETSLSFVWRKALCKDQKGQKKVPIKLSSLNTTWRVPRASQITHWENTLTHPHCSPPFPPLDIFLFSDSLHFLGFCVSGLSLHSFQTYDAFLYTFFPKATWFALKTVLHWLLHVAFNFMVKRYWVVLECFGLKLCCLGTGIKVLAGMPVRDRQTGARLVEHTHGCARLWAATRSKALRCLCRDRRFEGTLAVMWQTNLTMPVGTALFLTPLGSIC